MQTRNRCIYTGTYEINIKHFKMLHLTRWRYLRKHIEDISKTMQTSLCAFILAFSESAYAIMPILF